MVKILKKWGYYIGNEEGIINRKSNIMDFVLFTAYFLISLYNSLSSNPSKWVFGLNTISIGRLILKNYMEQCKIISEFPKKEGYVSANMTKVHVIKIVGEVAALVLLISAVGWNKLNDKFNNNMSSSITLSGGVSSAITFMVIVVLIVTWVENTLCMFERLYDAKPMPLAFVTQQTN